MVRIEHYVQTLQVEGKEPTVRAFTSREKADAAYWTRRALLPTGTPIQRSLRLEVYEVETVEVHLIQKGVELDEIVRS